jgi:hypothetical protein
MKKILSLLSLALIQTSALKATTIDTIQPTPTFTVVNVSADGPSVGDLQTFQAPLLQVSTNKRIVTTNTVGQVSGVRTLIQPNQNLSWLRSNSVTGYTNGAEVDLYSQTMTFYFFGKGTIQVQGERFVARVTTNGVFALPLLGVPQNLPIVGGTQAYEHASGQVTLRMETNALYTNGYFLQHFDFKN